MDEPCSIQASYPSYIKKNGEYPKVCVNLQTDVR